MIQAIQQWLKQILQGGPFAGLDHHIGRHPGLQPMITQAFQLFVRYGDVHQIERFAGPLVHQSIRRSIDDLANQHRRVTLLKAGEIDVGRLPYCEIVDVIGLDLSLDDQLVVERYDLQHGRTGRNHAAHGVHSQTNHRAGGGRADINVIEGVLSRVPSLLKIDEFVRHSAQVGLYLFFERALQLDDLQPRLADLIGGARDRRDVFAAFALQTGDLAL